MADAHASAFTRVHASERVRRAKRREANARLRNVKVAGWNSFLLPACPDLRDNESDLNIIWNAVYLATFRGPNEYRCSLASFLFPFFRFIFRNERLAYASVVAQFRLT